MMVLVILVSVAAALLAIFLLRLAWNMVFGADRNAENGGEEGFQPERYRPMERLLLAEEFLALQQQPGYTRKIGDEWLRSRRKVFRMYLEELKGDFRRLHARARATVAHAPEESHELVGVLIRQQMIFWVAVTMVELRFACARLGFRQVDIRPLLATLDAMRLDLDRFAPQPA